VEQQLQQSKEIVRLVDIGVLEEDYSYELAFPSFSFSKKDERSTIRAVTDFRKLNLLLKRHPFPIPKIGYHRHDPFDGRVFLFFFLGLKHGLLSHQTRY
jgi:hypothetical protein